MKTSLLVFLLFNVSLILSAQRRINLDNLSIDQLNAYKAKAINMRNNGIGLTLSGIGITAVGGTISALWFGSIPKHQENFGIPAIPLFIGLAIGTPLEIVGIPLWVIGGKRNSNVKIAIKNHYSGPVRSPGLGLYVTFKF